MGVCGVFVEIIGEMLVAFRMKPDTHGTILS